LDISWGGAKFVVVEAGELGFVNGLTRVDLEATGHCVKKLIAALATDRLILNQAARSTALLLRDSLYAVIITDVTTGDLPEGAMGEGVHQHLVLLDWLHFLMRLVVTRLLPLYSAPSFRIHDAHVTYCYL
jgi:hypothetical protein